MRYTAILMLLFLPCITNAENLAVIKDAKLNEILTNFELLAETPKSSKMFARVLRVQAQGECDGSPSTCPKSTLYIAVSAYGEYPEQKLYQLPDGHNWEFMEWVAFPETPEPPSRIVFKVKLQKPSDDLKKSWWVDEVYTITVNYQQGSWIKQPALRDPGDTKRQG